MIERLKEISNKLAHLKRIDRNLQIFGAVSHKYQSEKISQTELETFEIENKIKLPSEFKDFLVHIGTGAGPDYGIYTLSQMTKEFEEWAGCLDESSKLSNQCDLKNNDALELIQRKQNNPSEFHYRRLRNANGILPIQTEGCTYYCCIILNGEQHGKIWSTDSNEFDALPAGIVVEFGFLDWYENWVDQCISKLGTQIKDIVGNSRTEKEYKPWWKRIFE